MFDFKRREKSIAKRSDSVQSKIALRKVLRPIVLLVFLAILLVSLLAAIPSTRNDGHRDDVLGSAVGDGKLSLLIIYPSRDGWGEREAMYLLDALNNRYDIDAYIASDKQYLAGESVFSNDLDPTVTVTLGVTELCEKNYLEVRSTIGYGGLEITVSTKEFSLPESDETLQYLEDENGELVAEGIDKNASVSKVDILSPSAKRVHEGIDAFLDAFYTDGYHYRIKNSLRRSDLRPEGKLLLSKEITLSDGRLDVLTISYIDGNSYTLRALSEMVDASSPDVVLFNGNVDGGASTRAELSEMWQGISSILTERNVPWLFLPGHLENSALPRVTVCEVISSFDGCLLNITGTDEVGMVLRVNDEKGVATSLVVFADTETDMYALCDIIENDIPLLNRLTGRLPSVTAFSPSLPACLDKIVDGEEVCDDLTDLYDCLDAMGKSTFVCSTSPTAFGTHETEDGSTVALCGSLGFDSLGLGGRFEYNNSQRCALLVSIENRRSTAASIHLKYIMAADLGLTER